jgi:hypothetical protein
MDDLFRFRAFATEFLKIAKEDQQKADVLDPDVRALHAEREGREYLPGGRLRSNSQLDTNWIPKIAARVGRTQYQLDPSISPVGQMRSGDDDMDMSGYSQGRRYALSGMGGALTGAGLVRAHEHVFRRVPHAYQQAAAAKATREAAEKAKSMGLLSRMFKKPEVAKKIPDWLPHSKRTHLTAAGIGAGLALTDRYIRERRRKKMFQEMQKQSMVQQFTPARALKAGQETHKFRSKQIHEGDTKDPAGIIGKKFRID